MLSVRVRGVGRGVLAGAVLIAACGTGPDYRVPDTGVVPPDAEPDKTFTLVAKRGGVLVHDGVVFNAMTFDGTVPGPLLLVDEGDVVEIRVRNDDNIPHGLSVHATYRNTGARVGNIPPGETKSLRFRATYPGVYMYHCAPGGHAIMMHTIAGMYGMIVVEPKTDRYRLEERLGRGPDLRLYLLQHEIYSSGKDAAEGRPLYVAFNGSNFRYVKDPIPARPGDYVRVYYLNVGPNLTGTFHLVGIIWDFMYYQGHPRNLMHGGQSSVAGPTDSWVVEFRVPEEGVYGIVTHAMGTQTPRGAMGLLAAKEDAPRVTLVSAQGPNPARSDEARRVVDTFAPGTPDLDPPVRFGPGDDVRISIVNNTYWPKVVQVPVGTRISWINEDAFEWLEGELTGRHNVVSVSGPRGFVSPILKHAETFAHSFSERGRYEYICTLHPYMRGRVEVR